jgi:hypothetical protein
MEGGLKLSGNPGELVARAGIPGTQDLHGCKSCVVHPALYSCGGFNTPPLGAYEGYKIPTAIPLENNIPRCLRRGY